MSKAGENKVVYHFQQVCSLIDAAKECGAIGQLRWLELKRRAGSLYAKGVRDRLEGLLQGAGTEDASRNLQQMQEELKAQLKSSKKGK